MSCRRKPDAVVGGVEFEFGCIGETPAYRLSFIVFNYGNEEITDYCIEIWNEDYYQCFDDSLFGNYSIPAGEGQQFTTPFFEYDALGSFFTISVDNVNDEIVTGNNNTTVYYPDELDDLVCLKSVNLKQLLSMNTIRFMWSSHLK